MSDSDKPKKKFRWGRFLVTFVILGVLGALGSGAPSGSGVAYECGRFTAWLILTLIVYGIDSLLLGRRERKKSGPPPLPPES
jgi:hypothetical protein